MTHLWTLYDVLLQYQELLFTGWKLKFVAAEVYTWDDF